MLKNWPQLGLNFLWALWIAVSAHANYEKRSFTLKTSIKNLLRVKFDIPLLSLLNEARRYSNGCWFASTTPMSKTKRIYIWFVGPSVSCPNLWLMNQVENYKILEFRWMGNCQCKEVYKKAVFYNKKPVSLKTKTFLFAFAFLFAHPSFLWGGVNFRW